MDKNLIFILFGTDAYHSFIREIGIHQFVNFYAFVNFNDKVMYFVASEPEKKGYK